MIHGKALLLVSVLAVGLAACVPSRPLGPVCEGRCDLPQGPISLFETESTANQKAPPPTIFGFMAREDVGKQLQGIMRRKMDAVPLGVPERALADLPRIEDGRLDILALSAGGAFGAFGAGFLNGWSTQTATDRRRPDVFDIVTGISTGALLATHAFLGRSGDEVLAQQYTTLTAADILSERSLPALFFSNALFDTAPLRATLERLVTPALLDEVAEATGYASIDGSVQRMLLVLAVNLDSGQPKILDLGAIARDRDHPERQTRYIDALMASAAIPVAFPPVFLEGGMYVDGGLRLILFFNNYMDEQRKLVADRKIPAPKFDIIVNGEIGTALTCTDNSVIGIGKRSFDILLDQLAFDSLYRAISEAERQGSDVRYVTAEGSGCPVPGALADRFQPAFLQCLFAHGKAVGSGDTPWKTDTAGFPTDPKGQAFTNEAACFSD